MTLAEAYYVKDALFRAASMADSRLHPVAQTLHFWHRD